MIDTIGLAVKSGVIDSADINSVHISEQYMADLARFAQMAAQAERAEILKLLAVYADNLRECGNAGEHHAVTLAIDLIEDLQNDPAA